MFISVFAQMHVMEDRSINKVWLHGKTSSELHQAHVSENAAFKCLDVRVIQTAHSQLLKGLDHLRPISSSVPAKQMMQVSERFLSPGMNYANASGYSLTKITCELEELVSELSSSLSSLS